MNLSVKTSWIEAHITIIIEYCGGIFYNFITWGVKIRILAFAALFLLGMTGIFSQEEQRYIPEELLRPRRGEAPRYPIDTVIGPLGRGQASAEAYQFARNVASALLAGNLNASVLSAVNKGFLENCMNHLQTVNPRFYRLGGGREEPDGSVSFLVRFVGRERGLMGELFVRFEEQRSNPSPQANEAETGLTGEQGDDTGAPLVNASARRVWVFEDLIMEEPRSREEENRESRHRYDFSPYERFF
jgi:hypothetical protein